MTKVWFWAWLCVLTGGTACFGKEVKLEATFANGTTKGSLPLTIEKATLDRKADFVNLDKPGQSKIIATPKMDRVPGRVFLSFESRVRGDAGIEWSAYTIKVNDETVVGPVQYKIDTYTSIGHDIAKACREGQNKVEIVAAPESIAPLQVRRVTLTLGEGMGPNDWIIFGLLAVAILLACRWVWFELFWRVFHANPIAATRVAIILTALLLFLAYLYSFSSLASVVVNVIVGCALLLVTLMILLR